MRADQIETAGKTILDQGACEFYTVTEHGITFEQNTPRETWLDVVKQLTSMHESSGRLHFRAICILADALNQGEALYGEEYAQAIEDTRKWMKVGMKTIQNAMWIMKSIDASRRRETLSLAHHELVAPLEPAEQDELLAQAEDEDMSVADLKKVVAERHPKTKSGKERKTKASKASSSFEITNATEAKQCATQLSNWLTENEEKITDAWKPVLDHFHKLFRRHWQSGHKK